MTVGRTPPPTRATLAGRAYLDLRAIAKKSGRANDEYLRLYALEGFLLRLAASASSQDFVLKGGVLLAAYQLRRPTADIDFAALKMSNDVGAIKSMIITVAATQLPDDQDDGLWFDTSDTHAVAIRDEDAYSGVRVTLGTQLATAKMRFHVDVNVGDPIWPRPATVQFPRLLGGTIRLLGYPIPMVLAEKVVTASQRGITSTRWRDFADIYLLTGQHRLVAGDVRAAINKVAAHRNAEVGPFALSWTATPLWRKRSGTPGAHGRTLKIGYRRTSLTYWNPFSCSPMDCSIPLVRAKQVSGRLPIASGASNQFRRARSRGTRPVLVTLKCSDASHPPETQRDTPTAVQQRATLQDHARHLMSRQDRSVDQLELSTGKVVRIRGTRIVAGADVAGMVLEIALVAEAATLTSQTVAVMPVPTLTMHSGEGLNMPLLLTPSTLSGSGQSPLWKRACKDIASAAAIHHALLVMGETGSGKFSLLAEIYHRVNPGGRSLLIDAVDISPYFYDDAEAALEATNRPTLYIFRNIDELSTDGVEELNKFLLALADSDRPVSVAATLSDANLDSDLPFRDLLVHFQQAVTVPPLRHRLEDVDTVVTQVLNEISEGRNTRVGPAAMRVIRRYSWPRNITQLKEALAAALLRRPVGDIQPEDLPGYCHDSARRHLTGMEALERDTIVKALRDADGNRVQAAATLGIARSSLYRKLKSFGITTI